eukprot:CAMPEP_0171312422 /NCGR_PEP_ID=MMETSP0816-20121228/22666_1 /TAXON_ID=420281 /ORGANISM="Proboscia inermis, Strain CCAP1064/1" /LENGTH=232 /DNA_ID=CAMNT_0011797777 /DNA_START=33 /DNA_END=731 /DNA_ORIENTATION=+
MIKYIFVLLLAIQHHTHGFMLGSKSQNVLTPSTAHTNRIYKKRIQRRQPILNIRTREELVFVLSEKENDTEDEPNDRFLPNKLIRKDIKLEDTTLLLGDVVVILLICQVFGLMDAMHKPDFWTNGGFMAPVTHVPATLSRLLQRVSQLSIAWVVSSLKNDGYSKSALVDDESVFKSTITTWVDFCAILILSSLFVAGVLEGGASINGVDLLRSTIYTLPILLGYRLLYSKYS